MHTLQVAEHPDAAGCLHVQVSPITEKVITSLSIHCKFVMSFSAGLRGHSTVTNSDPGLSDHSLGVPDIITGVTYQVEVAKSRARLAGMLML